MKSRKKQTTKKSSLFLKFNFNLMFVILIIGYPIYFLLKSCVASYQLSNDSKVIKAVIIDEENYVGHSPVVHRFFYSYEFFIDGKSYRGNSNNSDYKIGDSVEVRYSISNPSFNEIVK